MTSKRYINKSVWKRCKKQVGQNIQAARKAKGLTRQQLSDQTKYSVTHLIGFEERGTPLRLYDLLYLAHTLDIPPEDLLKHI